MVCHWKIYQTVLCCWVWGWMGVGVQGWGGGRSGQVLLIDNGRVYQSKAADALVHVKATTLGTNVGLDVLLNISSRYFGGLFWSRQLWGLPSSDGYFFNQSFLFWLTTCLCYCYKCMVIRQMCIKFMQTPSLVWPCVCMLHLLQINIWSVLWGWQLHHQTVYP